MLALCKFFLSFTVSIFSATTPDLSNTEIASGGIFCQEKAGLVYIVSEIIKGIPSITAVQKANQRHFHCAYENVGKNLRVMKSPVKSHLIIIFDFSFMIKEGEMLGTKRKDVVKLEEFPVTYFYTSLREIEESIIKNGEIEPL